MVLDGPWTRSRLDLNSPRRGDCNEKTATVKDPSRHGTYVLVRSHWVDCCSRMRYNPINNYIMAVQSMPEAMADMFYLKGLLRRNFALSTTVLEIVLYMLEVVNGVRCM